MMDPVRRVAVLGATGSIGASALDVIRASQGALETYALAANRSARMIAQLAHDHAPCWVSLSDPEAQSELRSLRGGAAWKIVEGDRPLETLAQDPLVDIVVAAIVGSAGLASTWSALEAGKTVALANKETLVVGGGLVTDLARRTGGAILPVDSEHSAIFQALRCGDRKEVRRIVLTASGGPFLRWSRERMSTITPQDALRHPTWEMGKKITIDSATMMNKALEIIEARWLFDVSPDQIEVMVHPQSVLHSLVEFNDGAVIAQLSPPDMRLPIQYALNYPKRAAGPATRLDWTATHRWELEPADRERFPALDLGFEVARRGGTAGAVVNAANEAAVQAFLNGELSFLEIVPACRDVLEHHTFDPQPTLADLLRADDWARQEIVKWVCA